MARIKIEDIPRDMKVTKEEMKKVFGGADMYPPPTMLGKYTGSSGGAGPAGPSTQTIVISDPSKEEAMFFAPEEMK